MYIKFIVNTKVKLFPKPTVTVTREKELNVVPEIGSIVTVKVSHSFMLYGYFIINTVILY